MSSIGCCPAAGAARMTETSNARTAMFRPRLAADPPATAGSLASFPLFVKRGFKVSPLVQQTLRGVPL